MSLMGSTFPCLLCAITSVPGLCPSRVSRAGGCSRQAGHWVVVSILRTAAQAETGSGCCCLNWRPYLSYLMCNLQYIGHKSHCVYSRYDVNMNDIYEYEYEYQHEYEGEIFTKSSGWMVRMRLDYFSCEERQEGSTGTRHGHFSST